MPKLPFDILYEDDNLIAINKPAGLLTLPDRHDQELQSVRGLLQKQFGRIWVVHRLDKETSGVMVFAKDEASHKYLSKLFEGRDVEKIYLGLVLGQPLDDSGTIDVPIAENPFRLGTMVVHKKGKASQTDYEVQQRFSQYSLLQFTLHTGRTHQIRVHCKHIGHPIVCDEVYGDGKPVLLSSIKRKYRLSKNEEEERPLLNRLALHASRLAFALPNGNMLKLVAPLHKDMQAVLNQLEKAEA
jgi:23S rRNA pseudouridine1911/1915/1917 synthase